MTDDLMSKVRQAKKEAEEMRKQGAAGTGEGDQLNADTSLDNQNLKPEGEGGQFVTDQIPEAEAVKEKLQKDDGYKQKYDVLQAKYDKEVPKLYAELKELRETLKGFQATIDNQNTLIKDLSAGKKPKEDDTKAHKATSYAKLDLEDFDDYDDGIKKILTTLNAVIDEADALKLENTKLKSENDAIKNDFTSVKETATQTSEAFNRTTTTSFWNAVNAAAPNFVKYNGDENGKGADPKWINFLKGFDDNMIQYRAKANDAMKTLDAESFVSVIKEFEKLMGNNGGGKQTKKGLDNQVIPGRGAASQAGGGQGDKIVTLDDLKIAEQMMRSGKLATTDYKKLLRTYEEQQRQGA